MVIKKVLLLGCWLAIVSLIVTFFIVVTNEHILAGKKFENMVGASVLIYDDNGHGSGVFIKDNVILTAAHCLKGKDNLSIELIDGTILESSDFYIDDEEDVGFIYVEADEPHIAEVSEIPCLLGDTIYLVGTPYLRDYKFTLVDGIVSNLDRDNQDKGWTDLLQVDSDGGVGMSGGPLYDSEGKLIGVYAGQSGDGGHGITVCEDAGSILRAYGRYEEEKSSK